jgi:uncharacterized membrane protein YfcA
MKLINIAPIGFLLLAIAAILLPKDIFTAIIIFLMIISALIMIFSSVNTFDDERDEK